MCGDVVLEPFKCYNEKKVLLHQAIELNDGNAIICVRKNNVFHLSVSKTLYRSIFINNFTFFRHVNRWYYFYQGR